MIGLLGATDVSQEREVSIYVFHNTVKTESYAQLQSTESQRKPIREDARATGFAMSYAAASGAASTFLRFGGGLGVQFSWRDRFEDERGCDPVSALGMRGTMLDVSKSGTKSAGSARDQSMARCTPGGTKLTPRHA
ncbi:hypothetical protein TRAPUB_4921 [Trametes pubescens]|uniref:Uncharacterized protein n=1 Tax=Trametes pubescens TaxID=154538 RepID=A0A1M2V9R7_TRAPU|nr:hypothetical protein TRAPUB_4921 [Trametes pubescens]